MFEIIEDIFINLRNLFRKLMSFVYDSGFTKNLSKIFNEFIFWSGVSKKCRQ